MALVVKNPPANAGDPRDVGSVPESGGSPGIVSGTHSNILAWKIPWAEELGGLISPWGRKGRTRLNEHTTIYFWGWRSRPLHFISRMFSSIPGLPTR